MQKFIDNPKMLESGYCSKAKLAQRLGTTIDDITESRFKVKQMMSSLDHAQEFFKELKSEIVNEHTTRVDNEKGTITSDVETTFEPKNDIELAELHKIDLTKYKISTYWSKLKSNGKFTSSVLATLRNIDKDIPKQKESLIEEIDEYFGSKKAIENYRFFTREIDKDRKTAKNTDGQLLEISIPDLHIGKMSHREETGEDYDLKIASARYKNAITQLLKTANLDNVSDILLPIGNDLFNVDNQFSTTTGGTPQDCDSRFHKMVGAAKELLINTITGLSAFARVHVLIVPGNHDEVTTFMLGEILEAWFHNDSNITVNNTAKLRKYFQFGKNSFLYTHGDKEKHGDLGLIFATEEPRLWADTKYRFVKLGHLHKQKKIEYITTDTLQGFQIEILPSLSSADKWHYGKGFLGAKQAKAYLYDKELGEIAQYTHTV